MCRHGNGVDRVAQVVPHGRREEIRIAVDALHELRHAFGEDLVDSLVEADELRDALLRHRDRVGPHSRDARTQCTILGYELDQREARGGTSDAVVVCSAQLTGWECGAVTGRLRGFLLRRLLGLHVRGDEAQHALGIIAQRIDAHGAPGRERAREALPLMQDRLKIVENEL